MTTIQEDVHYDGGPAKGDLIFNLLLGVTLIGLPFTIGAVVRALWLRFRITSRRISVTGGCVQRGGLHPSIEGVYFYGDYGSGRIWGLRWDGSKLTGNREVFQRSAFYISSFDQLNDGTILVSVFRNTFSGKGRIYAIKPAAGF